VLYQLLDTKVMEDLKMASYGAQQNGSFSSTTLNQISTAVANGLKLSQRSTPVNTGEKRRQDYLSGINMVPYNSNIIC